MFPATVQTKDRPHLLQHFIGWADSRRPAGGPFLIGKVNFKAVAILIFNPRLGEFFIGPLPEPGHIPGEHVVFRLAIDDPLCRHQTKATGL